MLKNPEAPGYAAHHTCPLNQESVILSSAHTLSS